MDLEAELDELYRSPRKSFVSTRNELAKRLRKGGDRDAAERVKKLAKPSLTAWAVNQLAFKAAEELAALIAAGAAMRAAHLASAAEQQKAAKIRRDSVAALLTVAGELFTESGQTLGASHRQRISRTLEALSSQVPDGETPRAGRLSKDLEPAGFDALADLAAALGQAQARRPNRPEMATVIPISRGRAAAVSREAEERVAEEAGQREGEDEAQRESLRREAERLEAERLEAERRESEACLLSARQTLEELEARASNFSAVEGRAVSELAEARRRASELAESARAAELRALGAREEAEVARVAAQQAEGEAETASAALRDAELESEEARQKVERLSAQRHRLAKT